MLFRFPIFGGLPGRGVLSRIKALIDAHSAALDNVEGEDGIAVRKNWKGGLTISGSTRSWGSSAYTSYFMVYDASTESECKVGVTDGGVANPTYCGAVRINGVQINLEPWTATLAAAGVYWIWLHMWIAVDGEHAEIRKGAVDDDDPPDNPNGGVAFSSQLLGRVTVADGAISARNQDYLRGGEHVEYLYGDCSGASI